MSSKATTNYQIVTLIKEVQQQMQTGFIDVRNEFKSELRSSEARLTQKIDSVEVGLTQRIDGVEAKFDRIHLSQIHDNGLLIANLKHQNRRITLLEKAPRLT